MFFSLVLGVGAMVFLIWWIMFKALLSRKSGHAGPVQDAVHNSPLPPAVEPKQTEHVDHKFDDWQRALHESSASNAEWAEHTEVIPSDYHEELRATEDPTSES